MAFIKAVVRGKIARANSPQKRKKDGTASEAPKVDDLGLHCLNQPFSLIGLQFSEFRNTTTLLSRQRFKFKLMFARCRLETTYKINKKLPWCGGTLMV